MAYSVAFTCLTLAALMVDVTSLSLKEQHVVDDDGDDADPDGTSRTSLLETGSLPTGSASPDYKYQGETLFIGGTIMDQHGQEDFNYTASAAAGKIVWRQCLEQKGYCTVVDSAPSGAPAGLCLVMNYTKLMSTLTDVQTPYAPFMPGYTICGYQTQLTVYPHGGCGDENSIQYKTIGHCDNSTRKITQCISVKSAKSDALHAVTSHYKLTACNFTATTVTGGYRGPHGTEMSKKGQVFGSDVEAKNIKKWQEQVLGR